MISDPIVVPDSFPEVPPELQAVLLELRDKADTINRRREELTAELVKLIKAERRLRRRLAHYLPAYDQAASRFAEQCVMQTVRLRKSIIDRGDDPEADPEFLEAVERMQTMQKLAKPQTGANGRQIVRLKRLIRKLTGGFPKPVHKSRRSGSSVRSR